MCAARFASSGAYLRVCSREFQWPALCPPSTWRVSPVTKVADFEVEDGVHDVSDLAHSAERVEATERIMRLDWMHRRFDDAGSDRVRPDAALRVFDRQ